MLMAAGIAQISPLQIMKYLYYPLILGVCSAAAIVLGGRANRKHASGPEIRPRHSEGLPS